MNRTSCLENGFPHFLHGQQFRVGEDEGDDFIRILVHPGLDGAEIVFN